MNTKFKILAEMPVSECNELIYKINDSVDYVLAETGEQNHENIYISIPNYFWDAINCNIHFQELGFVHLAKLTSFRGCLIIPSPNNDITVFHVNSPLYEKMNPQIIKIYKTT